MGEMDESYNGSGVESYRRELAKCTRDVAVLSAEVRQLNISLNEKHTQNRRDIHGVRNDMQEMSDNIHDIKLGSAKARGYWMGIWAAIVVVWEILRTIIEHAWK